MSLHTSYVLNSLKLNVGKFEMLSNWKMKFASIFGIFLGITMIVAGTHFQTI